ncbi:DNA-binding transcriptional ArsR family regulator [Paenibacillus brasilensis]|uniref:DNA-binding transcriptional ArsR family regulator n=2 Tax=Paenibacillus brasilensis TaxID=128574 RepID=A0ABU0KXN7_9BACL|nr:DNA-binding transcriptional ArsR family regulator [Paenibacillus brasilensis]
MNMYKNIASIAALFGDPTRTTILASLVDGRPLTAGELAYIAEVSPQTASAHLTKLVKGGLIVMEPQGRHRYYRLASSKVAEVMEEMASLTTPAPTRSLRESDQAKALRFARTCYEHLAGELGVAITNALLKKEYIQESDEKYRLTALGEKWLIEFGVKIDGLNRLACSIPRHIDWTERHYHIGGPIAVGITRRLIELGFISRGPARRSILITEAGRIQIQREFDLEL